MKTLKIKVNTNDGNKILNIKFHYDNFTIPELIGITDIIEDKIKKILNKKI